MSSSPLRFLSKVLAAETAESRSHPDATRDVWEVAVWDPTPLSLKMFCLFSPGHVLVYWLFLPTAPQESRPSTVVMTTVALASLLSVQLILLQSSFSQQSKDASVIHKEVLNEYDTKFVHPRTQPRMRDVGTQFSGVKVSHDGSLHDRYYQNSVDTYTPTVIINRGFHTVPNPNYTKHVDPEGYTQQQFPPRGVSTNTASSFQTPAHLRDVSSPLQPRTAVRQPQFRSSVGPGGDGGSLGVYTHANSPLKKAASQNFAEYQRERQRSGSPLKRETSPSKRTSMPGGANGAIAGPRFGHLPNSSSRRESGRF